MFAAALALGLLAVAFILTLLYFRNAPCVCCRRRAGSHAPPAAAAGAKGAVASPATVDSLISVSSSGGGFVLYTGSATEQRAAGVVV